jgi:hypothetical protein
MLIFSNDCGKAIHNGRDIAANIIPRRTETMTKSILLVISHLCVLLMMMTKEMGTVTVTYDSSLTNMNIIP